MAIGYTKVGGTVYEIGAGLVNSSIAQSFSGESGTYNQTQRRKSYSFTLPAGHDYMISVTVSGLGGIWTGPFSGLSSAKNITFSLTGGTVDAEVGAVIANMPNSQTALPNSYTITTVLPAQTEDTTLTASIVSGATGGSGSGGTFSGFAIALN